MAWVRRPFTTIFANMKADFLQESGSGDAVLRRSPENALTYAFAGGVHGLYGAMSWMVKQIIPSEDSDLDALLRWTDAMLTVPRVPASGASGTVRFTGTDGAVVLQGSGMASGSGASFASDASVTVTGGIADVPVTAIEPGVDGNVEEYSIITLDKPILNVDPEGIVQPPGLSGGADVEGRLGVYARLRDRFRNPPLGGSAGNYVTWSMSAAGITRAFEFKQEPNVGWVTVVVLDDNGPTAPIPGANAIDNAIAAMDAGRPIAMGGVNTIPPVEKSLALQWSKLKPDNTQTRANVEANVDLWFKQRAPESIVIQSAIENAAQSADLVASITLSDPTTDQDPGQYGMFTTITHTYI